MAIRIYFQELEHREKADRQTELSWKLWTFQLSWKGLQCDIKWEI